MEKIMRKIISIDEEKCDGCGLCIPSCEEGALQIVEGKARLVKEVYCDGLGNCLGECPQGAIEIIEREAEPFDEAAVEEHLERLAKENSTALEEECSVCCGSSLVRDLKPQVREEPLTANASYEPEAELSHWPVQLHLVNPQSRFLREVDLLIAADCGCPKLDDVNAYHQKLVQIFKLNNLKSITLVHMEVGCCFGLSRLVKSALAESGVSTPLEEVIVGVDGNLK